MLICLKFALNLTGRVVEGRKTLIKPVLVSLKLVMNFAPEFSSKGVLVLLTFLFLRTGCVPIFLIVSLYSYLENCVIDCIYTHLLGMVSQAEHVCPVIFLVPIYGRRAKGVVILLNPNLRVTYLPHRCIICALISGNKWL